MRGAASLDVVRFHDLRHPFGRVGARVGMSLPLVGALLGHRKAATTAHDVHLSDDPPSRLNSSL
ncbi:hypothetical protein [Roseovarius sp.]|uniref:hypothetical protein n=1 Tax=Roseovarius sp. TaxID=1486281 RepID=UPI003D0EE158